MPKRHRWTRDRMNNTFEIIQQRSTVKQHEIKSKLCGYVRFNKQLLLLNNQQKVMEHVNMHIRIQRVAKSAESACTTMKHCHLCRECICQKAAGTIYSIWEDICCLTDAGNSILNVTIKKRF